ncbi:MAG: hypothetical protein RR565_10160 [Erysipelothrix sp.]
MKGAIEYYLTMLTVIFGILITWQLLLLFYQSNQAHLMRERGIAYLNNSNLSDIRSAERYLKTIQCEGCKYDLLVEEKQYVLHVYTSLDIPILGLNKDVILTGVSYIKEK